MKAADILSASQAERFAGAASVGGGQAAGILKLNETLITLPRTHLDAFADSGLEVALRPLDNGARMAPGTRPT